MHLTKILLAFQQQKKVIIENRQRWFTDIGQFKYIVKLIINSLHSYS